MTLTEIRALITAASNPALAEEPGMVYQIWEDGEITLQKSGPLLWQRNLHGIETPTKNSLPLDAFPFRFRETHAFAFVEEEAAYKIRAAIREWKGD